ncbi:uncharacterized protein [Drosophila kikkawai]|uniref:MD-2-related lipid-recognition domain-containing protein n=1 Tax=Drosophila kikkawai TaxID=30033 RepID=A0A6P4IAY6_DROKI|nr:uncharacterized protein LOC108076861 [Drosophila kikkawai]
MLGLRIYLTLMLLNQAPLKCPTRQVSRPSVWDFRIRLLGREHRVNGTVTIKEDLDNVHHTVGIETYNDASGSGHFKQMPFFVPQQSVCKAVAGFWFYVKASIPYGEKTDMPFESHPCPIPKGQYYVKDVTIKPELWPIAMPRGYFKYVLTFKKDAEVVSRQEVVIYVVDRRI